MEEKARRSKKEEDREGIGKNYKENFALFVRTASPTEKERERVGFGG